MYIYFIYIYVYIYNNIIYNIYIYIYALGSRFLAPRLTQPFILLGLIELVQGSTRELRALRQLNPVHGNYTVHFFQ